MRTHTQVGIGIAAIGVLIFALAVIIGTSDPSSAEYTLKEIMLRPIGEQPTGMVLWAVFMIVILFGRK